MWELSEAEWAHAINVNLWGVVHGIRHFVPLLVKQNAGHVVNVSSAAGLSPPILGGAYAASKAAVITLSECLRHELTIGNHSVSVTVVCPAYVQTSIGDALSKPVAGAPEGTFDEEPPSTPFLRYLVDNGRPQQFHFVQSLGSIPAPDHPFRLTGPATFFKFVQNFWRQDNQGGGGGEIPHDDTGELTASMDRGRVYFFRIHSYNLWKPLDGAVADLLKQAEAEGEQMRRQFESGRLTGMDAER